MLAFSILIHALRQLCSRSRAIILLSAPPLVGWLAFHAGPVLVYGGVAVRLSGGAALAMIGLAVLILVLWLNMSVAWHRHVLLGEPARQWAKGRGHQLLSFVGHAVLLSLVLLPAVAAAFLIMHVFFRVVVDGHRDLAALVAQGFPVWFKVLNFVVGALLLALLLRLSTALAGAALRQPRPLGTAWRATRGQGPTFILLGAVMYVTQLALPLAAPMLAMAPWPVIILTSTMVTWLSGLLWLSVTTTLWGHFVEGRALR